jgi:hypothetical protein
VSEETDRERLVGRHSGRWENNIKMDLKDLDWGGLYRIAVSRCRDRRRSVMNAVMNFQAPYNVENFLTS